MMRSSGNDNDKNDSTLNVEEVRAASGEYVVLVLGGKMVYDYANIFAKEL